MHPLRIGPTGRYLESANGSPFFYLADTAWELFHRLTREEADSYLHNRAAKGFTVIQAVVLAEIDGLHTPNAYGACPLIDDDPTRPDDAYFSHVDYIINRAESLHLTIGLLPTWGDKVGPVAWGSGPQIFTPDNAQRYGEFLGRRYRDKPIIWILGGDRPIETETQRAIWRAMAMGIRAGDAGCHLITFHPAGGYSSSAFVHSETWLDFHLLQSGHHLVDNQNYRLVLADRALSPVRPVLDSEPRYEDHPINWQPDALGWFDAFDVRQGAYWSVLAGACGITYGCHDLWQFWQPDRAPVAFARTPWQTALDLPGACQMRHLRALFVSRPFDRLAPYQEAILAGQEEGTGHIRAARAEDGSFLFAYLPTGNTVTLAMGAIAGPRVVAHWYDPREGNWARIGTYANTAVQSFTPPTRGRGEDWILVLDDESAEYPTSTR